MSGRRISALALLLSCASAPLHANVASYGGDCWQSSELDALKLQRFKTMLLVAMLNCRDQEPGMNLDYNRFIRALAGSIACLLLSRRLFLPRDERVAEEILRRKPVAAHERMACRVHHQGIAAGVYLVARHVGEIGGDRFMHETGPPGPAGFAAGQHGDKAEPRIDLLPALCSSKAYKSESRTPPQYSTAPRCAISCAWVFRMAAIGA